MKLTFHGIKNDYDRDGFTVSLPPAENFNPKIDPKDCLFYYIKRTEHIRKDLQGRPVFITLRRPYLPMDSSTIANVMSESISLEGLSGKGFTAKSFRPTGATCALDTGINPDVARYIGRWRSADTFFKHYVHSRVPDTYLPALFNHV